MRKIASLVATALIAAVALVVPFSAPAQALSDNLGFTADHLPTWQANGTVWATAAAGGTVFAGGTFSQLRPPNGASGTPLNVSALTSFNAATGQPGTCQPSVTLSGGTATVRALTMSPDGKTLYIGGNFSNVAGTTVGRLAALDVATCTVKQNFKPSSISSFVRAIAVTSSTVYFAGDFMTVGGQTRQSFAAVATANAALQPFTANAGLPGRAIAVAQDGSTVAIGGDFFTINGQDSHSFAVVDPSTGANVRDFPRGFVPDTSVTMGITTDAGSYYAGNEGTGGGVFDGSFSINYSDLNQRWRDLCLGATQALLVENGTLYEASHHHDCSLEGYFQDGIRNYLTANLADDDTMLAWRPQLNDGLGEHIGPRALAIGRVGGTNYLWVGGEFTLVNGVSQQSLTRFASTGDTGAPTIPGPVRAESLKSGAVDFSWRTSYDSDDGDLTYTVYRNNAVIGTVKAQSRWWTRPQMSYTDTTAVPGTTYLYQVTASDGTNTSGKSAGVSIKTAAADTPYATKVVDDGATLYWRYNDASGRYGTDSSPANHEPNYMNVSGYRAGTNAALNDGGYDMNFNGSNSYAYSDDIEPAPSTYTVETWFKTTTTSGGKLIGYGDGQPTTFSPATDRQSSHYDRHIYMTNDGKLIFGAYVGGTVTVSSAKAYNDGQWHQVVGSQGSGGMTLYVDGLRVAKNGNSAAQSYDGSWRVGGDNLNGWPSQPSSNFFAGEIDETSVYPTVLSNTQVRDQFTASGRTADVAPAPSDAYGAAVYGAEPDLYWRLGDSSATTAADSGPGGNTGTYNSGSTGSITTGVTGALSGVSDKAVTLSSAAGNGGTISSNSATSNPTNYSVEAWFKTNSGSGGKIIGFGNNPTGLSDNYDRHVYMQDDGKLVFGTWTGQTNTITSDSSYNNNAWHHVVATQSTTDGMKLYVDGALVGTNGQTGAQDYAGYWKVGGDPTWGSSSPYFNGSIDEAAVYSSVLSAGQIAQHYALGSGATPPDVTAPTAPSSVTTNPVGETGADITWTASTDSTGVTGYAVYRGATAGFTPDAGTKVADVTGTSYSDTGLAAGNYYYKVTASDAAGNVSDASAAAPVTIIGPDTHAPSAPGNLAVAVDESKATLTWTASNDDRGVTGYTVYRGDSAGFTPGAVNKVDDVSGTTYSETGLPAGTYYYKVTAKDAAGNVSEASDSASAVILGPDTQAPSVPSSVTATVTGETSAKVEWSASTDDRGGAVTYTIYRGDTAGFTPGAGNKVDAVTATSYSETGLAAGTYYYKVTAKDAAGNVSDASSAADVTVAGPDAQAPSVPSGVGVVVDGSKATVSWSASTDNKAVTKYTVYRGASAGFTPAPGNKVADVTSGLTYADAGLPAGTYFYKVTASDAAGNVSDASASASAVIAAAPADPVTMTLAPIADTYVNQAAKTTEFGSSTSLAAAGGSSIMVGYLKFAVPEAPAGTVLSSATLRVRTSSIATAGSAGAYDFSWADSSWSESNLLFADRPLVSNTVVGILPANSQISTTYSVDLSPSAFSGHFGSDQTLALTSSSSDNLWLWSRNHASASYRPQLTLVFTP